jgi:hypothetical protein
MDATVLGAEHNGLLLGRQVISIDALCVYVNVGFVDVVVCS